MEFDREVSYTFLRAVTLNLHIIAALTCTRKETELLHLRFRIAGFVGKKRWPMMVLLFFPIFANILLQREVCYRKCILIILLFVFVFLYRSMH